jgi:hypothetical protein
MDTLVHDIDDMLIELSRLTGKNTKIPDTIMILPITDVYDFLMQENYRLFNNNIILGYEPNMPMNENIFDSEYHKQYLVHSLVSAATWKKEKLINQDLEIPILFDAYFAKWFHNQRNWGLEDPYFSNLISLYKEEPSDTGKKQTIAKINQFMSSNDLDRQYEFLIAWYQLQIETSETDWELLSDIVDKFL